MANQDPLYSLEERREQVLVILRRVGRTNILNNEATEAVQSAETIVQLIASINNAIMRNGITGIPRGDLDVLKGLIKVQYPR